MDAANHNSNFALVAVYRMSLNPTLLIDFGMGCLNGLVYSVGDHIGRRRHTFAELLPKKKHKENKKHKTISGVVKFTNVCFGLSKDFGFQPTFVQHTTCATHTKR